MGEDGLTKTAKRIEAVRKILTNAIWIVILVVILAAVGRFLLVSPPVKPPPVERPTTKPIVRNIPWDKIDKSVEDAIHKAQESTKSFAEEQVDVWFDQLMTRVDNDFLEWYFSYWTQQVLGLKSLWHYSVRFVIESQPTATEKLTEEIQEQFSNLVLRPQLAQLEMERIVRETASHYVTQLKSNLTNVSLSYSIPQVEWDRYLESIAITTTGFDGRNQTLSLKAFTATGLGGTTLFVVKMKALISKLTSKVMAKSAGKAASKMAAKTGGKVVAKAGGKFFGLIVGVGVLVWDVWDNYATKQVNKPILRKAMVDYFKELKSILMTDSEAGIMTAFIEFENQVISEMNKKTLSY